MNLTERWDAVMMPNYGTPPLALDHGRGARVWDVDGAEYLDFVAGIAVSALGHAHPRLVEAITAQASRFLHTSNLAIHEPGVQLAERLTGLLGIPARVFFANSGAEANECALKLTRRYAHATGRAEVVASNGGFHGRTLGALSITGNPAKREPFTPLPGGVRFVDHGDLDQLRTAVGPQTAAVFVEPSLGEGGVVPLPSGFLTEVRRLCDETGALMVVDEVQSAIGRVGHWFAVQAEGVRPDIITLAKGLGGGLPIGACLGVGDAGTLFGPGDHGSTFGANPVACSAALAVLDTIEDEHLLDQVKRVGEHLGHRLDELDAPILAGHRGSALWRGLVLTGDHAGALEAAARRRGLLINAVKPDVIRLAPPLIVTEADVDEAVPIISAALDEVSTDA